MAKEVSVGVKVKLEADAREMQRIIDDLETRLSNIKPGTSLEKTLTKQLQQLKAQVGDFSLISGQQIINQSDLATAANIAKRFFRDVGRISDSYEKAPFGSLQFTDDQLKNLKKAEKALEDFKAKSKDSLNKKTTGEVFGKYAEDAKKIQQTSAKLKKSFAMDDSFEETKKRIQKSKEQAEKDVELTNKKLTLKQDEKMAAESAKKTAEANFNQKKAELAKTYKLEESLQKKADLAKNVSKQKQFKSQKEVKDFFDKELFTSSGAFKAGGQDKANQLLSWMGFKPEEIPAEAAKIKQKIRDEIINAPLSQSQEMANKMQANAKKFLDKDYAKAVKDNETLIKKDQGYIEAEKALKNSEATLSKKTNEVDTLQTNLSTQQLIYQQIQQLETEIDALWQKLEGDEAASNKTNFEKLKQDITDEREKLKKQVQNNYTKQDIEAAAKVNQNVRGYKDTEEARLQAEQEAANFKANLQASIKHWMGAQQIISFVKRGVRQAYKDVQGLDKAMTNIAVVTDFSVSDLWGKINDYMQVAQQYGVTTQGVYEVSQLYYQQGLGEADVMAATTETLKMARIAGMQYSDAADGMTVAIRGFNMEMEEASRITDVYSKVAAITASDTQELVTAMSKTASSAASVGSSFEDTTAMLAVMIEATRESPQNIGSAMKSIISRYGEMTKGLKADSEGEEIDYNRVDTALKSVGISLKDAQGQFRNFNSVIFELADTWDTLDSVTQRYIATIFAGNRQQSRFLALVSNAERLREVSEAAADSEDAGLLQYSKTLDSLETKLNNIKTSFQQFYMSIINGDNVKGLLDFINDLIKGLNKLSKFTTILNLGSIISGIKIVLTLLTNTFSISFANIGAAWKKTLSEMTLFSKQESKKSGMVYGQGFQEGQQTALAIRGKRNFKINSSPLTGAALSIGGSIFSALGSKIAANNQTSGAILSGIGSGLSTGGMAMAFGLAPQVAVIAAAVSGILSIISSLPSNNEKLQEAFDKQVELTEESNIKRAEAQNDYKTLKTSIDNIKELEKTKNESEENYEKWVKANNDLVAAYPTLFGYIDEAGNTIADLSNSSDLLKTSFENAAYAAKQYYQNEALRIEKELQLNKEYEYVFNGAHPLNPKSWGQVGSIVGQLEAARTNQVEGLVEWSLYSNQYGLSSKEIAQRLEELGLTAQELLLEGITDSFSSFQSQQLFAALRNAGAITGNEKDEFSFESHFQSYLLAEQQLQDLYATKEQAMQSGVKFASLQSEMDDSIESYKNYSDIIVQLAKISYGDDLSKFDYSTLVNLTEDSYNELITPFLELYSTLSEGKREILSELGQNLTKYTPQDLIKLFTEEFGSSVTNEVYLAYANLWGKANSREIGKLVEGALPDGSQIEYSFDGEAWKEEYIKGLREGTIKLPKDGSYAKFAAMNPILMATTSPFDQETINEEYYEYLANLALWEEQIKNDFSSVRTRDFLDFSQWLKDDIGKEYSQKDSSVQYEAYMNYVGDYVSRIYEELHPDNILRLIFDEAGNLRIALDAAKSLMNFSAERDKIISQSSSVSAREAAKSQKKELLKVAAEIDLIDFSKKDWINNEVLLNFITGGLSELTEQDLLELQKLLLSENVGTSDWEKDLLAFGKSKNIQLVDLNKYIYEYVFTKINTIIGNEEEFIENFEGLFSKQQEGFTLEEADKIASQLKSTREKEFKISEGKLVLKDFEKAIDVLYQSKVTEIEEITDDINAISEATKTSEFKQLFKDSDQLSKKTLDGEAFTSLALEKQKNLKAEFERYYQEIAEISDPSGMADATVKYLVDTTDASLEGFINFLKTQAESNALVADYYNALIKELEQNKFLEDLIKGYEGSDKEKLRIEALETLKSTGGEALSAEQLGKVQYGLFGEDTAQYLKVRDNFDGTFTISAEELARVSEEASNIANNIALDKIDAVTEDLMALGKSVANKEVLTTEEKQKILGEEFNNQSEEAIETYWNYYENALSSGDYSELEKVLSIGYGEKKSKEMIARFKDDIEENADNLLEWQLDLLEGTISHENLNKLSSQDSSFVESYDQAIALSAGKRASAIFSLYEQTYTKQLTAGDITASEALENTAKAASQQLDEWLGTSLIQFNKEATQGIEEGDLTQTTDEFGQLFVSTRKNAKETLESFYNTYSKGITDAGEIILDVQKLRADNRISEQEYAKFQRNSAEETFGSAEDLITRMASKDDVYADEIESFFEVLGAPLQEGEAELLLQGGVQTFLSKIKSTLLAAGVPQSDIDSRLAEIQAQLVDLLLESISSGISSLGEGIEGTLSNQDWNSLIEKYSDLKDADVTRTIKGVKLSDSAQLQLATAQYSEALSKGATGWDFAEQLWEVAEGADSAFGSIEAIEKALESATGKAKQLLQQLLNIAMLDEDDPLFNFMEQDATGGRTKNFDNFVNQIDKVKSVFSSFQSGEAIGYQDFYNMMDFMDQQSGGALSDFSQTIDSEVMPGLAKLQGYLKASGHSYEDFVNSVVANTDQWGKVDIGGVAAEMGISVEAAMEGMAEGMADGLKEVARKQIQYLSGLEAMLEALAALESIGDISLGLDLEFTTTTGETVTIDTLNDIVKYWEVLKQEDQITLVAKLKTVLENGNSAADTALQKVFGKGFSLYDLLGGENFFTPENFDIGTIEAITSLSDLTQGQAYSLAMKMDAEIKLEEGSDFTVDENGVKQYTESGYQKLQDYIKQNYKDFYKVEEYPFDFEVANKANVKLAKEGITIEGVDISGWSEMDEAMKTSVKEKVEAAYAEEGLDIEVSPEGKLISTPILKDVEAVNTNFQTAAEAASTLQTAIIQISTVASTFQVGSGFQSLADQLNAAADAAERLASALGIKVETPQMPEMPFGTGEGQINGMNHLSPQDILSLGMGPLSPEGLNAQLNQMFATQFAGDAALQIPAKIVGEGGADVTDALRTNVLSKPAIPVPGKLDLSAGGKGTGKEADKVEIEAEVDTESVNEQIDTLKTSMDTVSESSPIQAETTDNGTTQAVTELLNAAYEAAVLVEDSDPNTYVTETGSTFVKEQLDAVAQAANSIPTSINISVSVSGVAKALGSIALLKLAGGLWTGNMNDIGGSALANGNVEDSARKLIAGANIANKTLVGELGPELMVYNNQYHLVGQNGAEFVDVPKDAIVFNHLQTKGIFNGQMGIRGKAMAAGNVTGPAAASGIAGALAAVRRAKSVWQGLLNSLSAADLMGAGGGGGGGGDDNNLKAHIEDLQEWYNLSRQIAKIEQEINTLLAKRKNITDGHEYLKNLRETQKLLTEQVATQQVLVKYQQAQLEAQAQHINTHSIWSQFLTVGKDGLLQYKNGNETKGGKGSLSVLQQMNQMSGEKQVAFLAKLGYSYTDNDGNKLEGEELVAKFFEELQKQIDDYDALADTVVEAEEALEELESEIAAIEKEIRDNEIELGQNIYDIIVAAWEENIKNLKEQNDLIKEANEAYAEGIQEAIDAEREMYEQNKTISDREQLQRQLALLRRSGGSASEIADLESQLDDMLKDEYFANQEDALETIRDANERQVELMDQQVKLQEEALKYEKENGVIWTKVYEVMQGTDAEILNFMQGNDPSFFEKQTLEQENMLTEWAKKVGIYTEDRQRQNFIKELDNKSFTNSLVTADGKIDYTSIYNGLDDKEQKTLQSLFEMTYGNARLDGKNETEALKLAANALQEELKERKAQQTTKNTNNSNNNNNNNNNNNKNTQSNDNSSDVKYYSVTKYNINGDSKTKGYNSNDRNSAIDRASRDLANEGYIYSSAEAAKDAKKKKKSGVRNNERNLVYATGGIIDYTGPAWVDGSKSKPERILSAEQNKILEEGLAMNAGRSDRLQEMFSNFAENLGASVRASISNIINRTSGSAITIQPGAVQLNIEQLNDKYDVDELFNDVADRLYSIASKASGRGVNRR